MVRHFLEQGGEAVLWVEPYPTRLPELRDLFRGLALHDQGTPVPAGVSLLEPGGWPIEPVPGSGWLNRQLYWQEAINSLKNFARGNEVVVGVGRPSRLALSVMAELKPAWTFYDALDDFPAFYQGISRWSMNRREEQVMTAVDIVFVSSTALAERLRPVRPDVVVLPNGCDMSTLPEDLPRSLHPPVLGYIGAVASWFDWPLVCDIARAVPQIELRIIGPRFRRAPKDLPMNVTLLPPCRQDQAVQHLREFSVGLIPFRATRLTRAVDPIKYYEYRAMQLPIVTTRFGEMMRREGEDGVFFLESGKDAARILSAALAWRAKPDFVQDFRNRHDWGECFRRAGLFAKRANV